MTEKSTWGGARPRPPGREGGRPKSPYKRKVLVVAIDNETEWDYILEQTTPRERIEILLRYLEVNRT